MAALSPGSSTLAVPHRTAGPLRVPTASPPADPFEEAVELFLGRTRHTRSGSPHTEAAYRADLRHYAAFLDARGPEGLPLAFDAVTRREKLINARVPSPSSSSASLSSACNSAVPISFAFPWSNSRIATCPLRWRQSDIPSSTKRLYPVPIQLSARCTGSAPQSTFDVLENTS